MTPAWAQRREAWLSDCLVSPDIFHQRLDRLGTFVVPYQRALASEAAHHTMHLYLQGLLSQLPHKNAEAIAAWVDVERQVIQDFIGTVPWDHCPLVTVLVGQVAERLGAPDGIIAFDPSSFPKRGTHSVGVKRQWCGHRGKVDNCQVGVFMGYVSHHDHILLDFRLSLPEEWARDEQRRQACHVPPEVRYHPRQAQCLEMLDAWRAQVSHGWATRDGSGPSVPAAVATLGAPTGSERPADPALNAQSRLARHSSTVTSACAMAARNASALRYGRSGKRRAWSGNVHGDCEIGRASCRERV